MKNKSKRIEPTIPASDNIRVGIYMLGYIWVELWLAPKSNDGSFDWNPSKERDEQLAKSAPRIIVGCHDTPLWAAWGVLCHEVLEAALCDMRCRFRPTGVFQQCASDLYIFNFNHNQFTEVAARTGSYLCDCRKGFEREFNKLRKKGKK